MSKERPRRRLAPLVILAVAAAIIAALILGWRRCGWGRGRGAGAGSGPDRSSDTPSPARPRGTVPAPCALHLTAEHLTVDGTPADLATAIAMCGRAGSAHLRVAGNAPYGRFQELEAALKAADIPLIVLE